MQATADSVVAVLRQEFHPRKLKAVVEIQSLEDTSVSMLFQIEIGPEVESARAKRTAH